MIHVLRYGNPNHHFRRCFQTSEGRKILTLTGKLEKPESDNSPWESLQYRGAHLVEAFVIRKRDDKIVGRNDAFGVMIE